MVRSALLFLLLGSLACAQTAAPPAASSPSPAPADSPVPAPAPSVAPPPVASASGPSASPSGLPHITWTRVNVAGPYIAMTFDDGPSSANTPRLLDLAKQKHIKLTFFLIGQNAQRYPELVQRELAEGHEVGNHSWTHPVLSKMSDDAVHNELQLTQDAIVKASGYRPTLFRPPYGAFSARQRIWEKQQFGMDIILWDVDPLDWKRPGPAVVAQRIIAGARPGSIILSHDIHSQTVDAMPVVFDTLLAKGYKFVTVSELIAMDRGPFHKTPAASPAPKAN